MKVIAREALAGASLIVEEKLDGSNCGISFAPDGSLILQSRGHVLTGGPRERQFDLLKRWASHHAAALRDILGRRYIMYGEWLYARHTIPYDLLPHYFLEFDILDRETGDFLATDARRNLVAGGPVVSIPVLGVSSAGRVDSYIGKSRYSSREMMEGLYLKQEEGGRVIERFKYVRTDFLQAVADSDSHWVDRPIEPNRLAEGIELFA
jgi:hypothetical protein